eukprot:6194430-Pleurochrysis_carterae.AAC.1
MIDANDAWPSESEVARPSYQTTKLITYHARLKNCQPKPNWTGVTRSQIKSTRSETPATRFRARNPPLKSARSLPGKRGRLSRVTRPTFAPKVRRGQLVR